MVLESSGKETGWPSQVHKGQDYFHSSWIDLVISDLIGLNVTRTDPNGPSLLRYAPLLTPRTAPRRLLLHPNGAFHRASHLTIYI